MMRAYVAMRGPSFLEAEWCGYEDPLFEGIRLQEDVQDEWKGGYQGAVKDISQ